MKADDLTLQTALAKYHAEKLTSNAKISERLRAEYGIEMRYARILFAYYPITFTYGIVLQPSNSVEGP